MSRANAAWLLPSNTPCTDQRGFCVSTVPASPGTSFMCLCPIPSTAMFTNSSTEQAAITAAPRPSGAARSRPRQVKSGNTGRA